jgi:hypothetical protein
MGKTTNVELVKELSERNTNGKYDALIERARTNGYHDFKFDDEDKYPDSVCPKIDLVADLAKFPELSDIRQSVINGDYDESPDDNDKKKMAEESPFLANLFNKN